MKIPTGTLCVGCCNFFWNNCIDKTEVRCKAVSNGKLWTNPAAFLVDGETYDVPLVTKCTHFDPKNRSRLCNPVDITED
jgi:hypothetical protein